MSTSLLRIWSVRQPYTAATAHTQPTRHLSCTLGPRAAASSVVATAALSRQYNTEHLSVSTCLPTIYCSHFTCVSLNLNVKAEKLIVYYWEEINVTNLSRKKVFCNIIIITVSSFKLFATHSCLTIMLADTSPCFEYENPRPLLIKAVKINRTQIFIKRGPLSVGLVLVGLS